jgi:hypothetical protein
MTNPAGWRRLVRVLRVGEVVEASGPAHFSVLEFLDSSVRVAFTAPESTRLVQRTASEGRGGDALKYGPEDEEPKPEPDGE